MYNDNAAIAQVSNGFLEYQYEVLGVLEHMTSPEVTEICINRPGEVYLETRSGWQRVAVPSLTYERARQFCTAVVNESNTGQRITDTDPVVSLTFPTGQRAQFVIPPACDPEKVSITIRLPCKHTKTLDQYRDDGFFSQVLEQGETLDDYDTQLLALKRSGNYSEFFRKAVLYKKNIVVSGATGSGGAKGWDKGRYRGIDHIVFVLRDPRSGEMMVSQSRGGEGVELLPLDDYLAYKHKRGTKLFASDPLAEARSLLLSEKDSALKVPGVSSKPDRRNDHRQETNPGEHIQMQPADATVGLKRRPLLSEPGHPDYLLYVQSYDRLKQLSTELGFKDESAYVNAAASIAAEAKAQNLKRVDHVLLSTHGLSLFAVQGRTDDPGNQWVQIDKAAAVSHAVQLSTIEVDVLRQKRQEELSLDTEFRAAMTR